jgi:hypothetical protein
LARIVFHFESQLMIDIKTWFMSSARGHLIFFSADAML